MSKQKATPSFTPAPTVIDSPKAPRAHWLRRRWPWLLALGVIVLVLFLWSLDEQPPDISDLTFERLALSDEENGYVLFQRAAEEADKAVPSLVYGKADEYDISENMMTAENWDELRVSQWLTALEPVWPLFEKASRATQSQGHRTQSLDDRIPEVGLMSKLGKLASLKATHDLHENNPTAAIATATANLRCATLLQRQRGSLITYLTGISIKSRALSSIAEIARHPDTSPDQLRELGAAMEATRDAGDGVSYAMRSEIYSMKAAQSALDRQGLGGLTDGSSDSAVMIMKIYRHTGIYRPNKTLRIYANYLRSALAVVATDEATLTAFQRSDADHAFARKAGFAFFKPDNLVGRMLLNIVIPSWRKLVSTQLVDQSHISATQAFIGLQLYRCEHGDYPATLDALVPHYLPAVPKDYSDGAPIRYSAELGVLWSIGKNNLAITSSDQETVKEVVIWLNPRTPKTEPAPAITP